MTPSGETDIWTSPRLRARLAAQKGLAPAPSCYVIWRATGRAGTTEIRGYELPEQPGRRDEAAFERWLVERNLAAAERLSVSVLVIREQLDASGLVHDCVLERRRGGVDGPYYGNVARVEFTGPAKLVRRYRATPDGRLMETPAEAEAGETPTTSGVDAESFAGEDAAVHEFLGPAAVILDRREPLPMEYLAGLSGIIHARRPDGVEVGCGVGWHGGIAFVIPGDFPRSGAPLAPPNDLAAAVENAVRTRDLIPYETRRDEQGFCVIARERGRQTLVTIRQEGKATRIDPYLPGRIAGASDDQRRWMSYAETYEARTILDSWRNGVSDEIAVLTIDPEQEAWRHVIDPDGVETSRRSDNEAAAAVLYRERLRPPAEAAGIAPVAEAAELQPPADSLLTKALAWSRATALLSAAATSARGGAADRPAALEQLRAAIEPMSALNASFSVGSSRRLTARLEAGRVAPGGIAPALDELIARFRDELAQIRTVLITADDPDTSDEPPFGPQVETRFPAAAYDIAEAMQCLTLRRSTASVLHAMQIIRHGLRALERLLATPALADLPWTLVIEAVRGAGAEQGDVIDALIQVRRAWRAPTLLPAAKYTEEEAEAVLRAVEAFMRLTAAMLQERNETSDDR